MDRVGAGQDIEARNERSLQTLARAIKLSQQQFALIIVRCNYAAVRDRMTQQLQARLPFPLSILTLPESAKTLYTTIQMALDAREPNAAPEPGTAGPPLLHFPDSLFIFGLEALIALDQALIATNIVREELRKQFQFPIVLWANDEVLRKLERLTPDLYSWAGNTIIDFEMPLPELVRSLKDHADRLFSAILDLGDEQVWANWQTTRLVNSLRASELKTAIQDLQATGYAIEPELRASLDFLLGQNAHSQGEMETARDLYEQSLAFWLQHLDPKEPPPKQESAIAPPALPLPALPHPLPPIPYLERAACILFYLGLWWRSYAVLQRATYQSACQRALEYFQHSLELFTQENRQDLVARFIIAQAETLQKLERWEALDALAKQALVLHKLYRDPVRQARDYGFLAETAIARAAWSTAKHHIATALQILQDTEAQLHGAGVFPNPHLEDSLELAQRYHFNWYLLLLAQAETHLGNLDAAILHLETARDRGHPQSDPTLYIQILRQLRNLYFEQGQYLQAFRTRQTRRLIEHQYGYRAFVGALRLQPLRESSPPFPLPPPIDPQTLLNQEIRASGRQRDLEQLRDRLTQAQYKLIVLHGPSGVGKSSIVSAGLAPLIATENFEGRPFLPILLDVYTDWQTSLTKKLTEALQPALPLGFPGLESPVESVPAATPAAPAPPVATPPFLYSAELLNLLRSAIDRNFLPVLILDQFEEFFFADSTIQSRRPFYYFLQDCLNEPFVKVVLALREDYLHYLLEFQRLTKLDIINNDILGKDIRYPLGDLAPEEAKAVIKNLTDNAQFYLPADLIDELVRDLAGELGEVRPIELQVVGAQLQAEGIDTLTAYHAQGPKERLVQRFLADAVKDCGPENENLARIVLFLLTNENGTRPLKTHEDLEADLVDLGLTQAIASLDLVLEVLVGSGLVFLIPESPADCYQLVHDYLVSFIRSQQEPEITNLQLELERERQKRQTVEGQLRQSEVQLQQVRQATRRRLRLGLGGLGVIAIAASAIVLWSFSVAQKTITAAKTAEISASLANRSLESSYCIARWLEAVSPARSAAAPSKRPLTQCTYAYTVVVPPARSPMTDDQLIQAVRQVVPNTTIARSPVDRQLNIGRFSTLDGALLLASHLEANGFAVEIVPLVEVGD